MATAYLVQHLQAFLRQLIVGINRERVAEVRFRRVVVFQFGQHGAVFGFGVGVVWFSLHDPRKFLCRLVELSGFSQRAGLGPSDWAAWRAMELLHDSGRARFLGVSNVSLEQLQLLCRDARIRPRFVQNRCYAVRGWDRRVREFCRDNDLVYQGFSLLTANRDVLARPELVQIAKRHRRSASQIVFRFALDVGMMPLTGTTDAGHMRDDLSVFDFRLEPDEIRQVENLATGSPESL